MSDDLCMKQADKGPNLAKRINYLLSVHGKKQVHLSDFVGKKPQTVSLWCNEDKPTNMGYESKEKIAAFFGMSVPEFEYGDSIGRVNSDDHGLALKLNQLESIGKYDSVYISMLTGDAVDSYNQANSHAISVNGLYLSKAWINSKLQVTSIDNLALFTNVGDCMQPTINDEDTLLVDKGITDITADAIYVAEIKKVIYIQRFQRRPNGSILMIPENKIYEPYIIDIDDVYTLNILARVRMKLPIKLI